MLAVALVVAVGMALRWRYQRNEQAAIVAQLLEERDAYAKEMN